MKYLAYRQRFLHRIDLKSAQFFGFEFSSTSSWQETYR